LLSFPVQLSLSFVFEGNVPGPFFFVNALLLICILLELGEVGIRDGAACSRHCSLYVHGLNFSRASLTSCNGVNCVADSNASGPLADFGTIGP